jgi:hypothetical protein
MGSSVFLDKSAFPKGTYKPGPTGPPTHGAHSTFDGELIFANLARDVVKEVLPDGLWLAQNTKEPALHPIALILAHHADCWWDLPGAPTPNNPLNYRELSLLIPFVQCGADDRWHNYVVRMYLDDDFAIWVGNTYYGYAKERAKLVRTDVGAQRKFEVFRPAICFTCDVTTVSHGSPAHYGAMRDIMRMPILGLMDDGKIVRSYWRWGVAATTVRVTACAHIIQKFVPKMAHWGQDIRNVDEGAVRMEGLRWAMEWPPDG